MVAGDFRARNVLTTGEKGGFLAGDFRYSMLDVRRWVFDVRCSMLDAGCSILVVWLAGLVATSWLHDPAQSGLLHVTAIAIAGDVVITRTCLSFCIMVTPMLLWGPN